MLMKSILCVVTLTGAGMVAGQTTVGPRERAPTINRLATSVPMARADKGRQVAVVNIRLQMENGKVSAARVVQTRRINSFAPKVFLRQGGDWEVRINGEERDRFFTFNPGYREAETGKSETNPYTWIGHSGSLDWRLVIPLYRGDRRIDARSIVVIDRKTSELIFKAAL